jgi:hypothetical protein
MHLPTNNQRHPLYRRIAADAKLGIAFLIAETEDGQYEPISSVATINEAWEMASNDIRIRMGHLERGGALTCRRCTRFGPATIVANML